MTRAQWVVVATGAAAMLATFLFPRDWLGRLFFYFTPHWTPAPFEWCVQWAVEIVVTGMLLLSFHRKELMNLRQRVLTWGAAFFLVLTIIYLPSSEGGTQFIAVRLREPDEIRLFIIWISIGVAYALLMMASSQAVWRQAFRRNVLITAAIAFLLIGLFPTRDLSSMSPQPHWLLSITDDEGDHRINFIMLLILWGITLLTTCFLAFFPMYREKLRVNEFFR